MLNVCIDLACNKAKCLIVMVGKPFKCTTKAIDGSSDLSLDCLILSVRGLIVSWRLRTERKNSGATMSACSGHDALCRHLVVTLLKNQFR